MSVLVIAPHADDEVLGCGGTIARRVAEGREVHVVVVGIGPVQRADGSLKVGAETRRAELAESCRRLGVASHCVLFEGLENRLDTLPRVDLVSRLDRVLEERAWVEVFAPGNACHQDHAIVHAAALAALRQRPGRRRESVCALYEYPLATWSSGPDDAGAWYVALGPHLESKMHALAAYASQAVPDPEPLSTAGVRRLAALRGSEVGVDSAERFRIVRRFEA
jgi:LmbE family N-acetylglucosaminyl deacetylase